MAEKVVILPNGMERRKFEYDVSPDLAAGNDVLFKDDAGNEIDVPFLQSSADATIVTRRAGLGDATKKGQYFIKGGWHQHWAAKFYATGTTASAGIIVRFD